MTTDVDSLFAEAYLFQRQNQLSEAIKRYEKLLEKEPKHAQALHFLGLAYAQLGDIDTSLRFLYQALELEPENANLHNNLANAYKKKINLTKQLTIINSQFN